MCLISKQNVTTTLRWPADGGPEKKEGLHYPRTQTKASTKKAAPRGTVVATVRSYRYDYKCVRVSLAFRFCDQAH